MIEIENIDILEYYPATKRKYNNVDKPQEFYVKWNNSGREKQILMISLTCDAKSWLIGKDPDAGKDWGQEEKGKTEDEMVGWHHPLDGHESEQTLGDGEGQGSPACCSPWGHKESDTTQRLNNNDKTKCCLEIQNAQVWMSFSITLVIFWLVCVLLVLAWRIH